TIVPWLYSRMGKLSQINKRSFFGAILHGFESGLSGLTNWISGILKWSLKRRLNKVLVLLIAVGLLFGYFDLVGMGYIISEFFAVKYKGKYYLQMEINTDSSLVLPTIFVQKADHYLAYKHAIVPIITAVGQPSEGRIYVGGSK